MSMRLGNGVIETMDAERLSSPCLGISNLLQSSSMRCFGVHPIKVSHKKETEVRLWTQSSNVDNWGNQDAIPTKHVVSRI